MKLWQGLLLVSLLVTLPLISACGPSQAEAELKDWWVDFRNKYSSEYIPTLDVRKQQEELFYDYIEKYETLYVEVSSLHIPVSCQKAHQLLEDYLRKHRPMVKDLIVYFATGNGWYRIQYNDKRREINTLYQQFHNEYMKIVDRLINLPPPPP